MPSRRGGQPSHSIYAPGGQLRQEIQRLEGDCAGSIPPDFLHVKHDASLRPALKPGLGQGRTQDVAGESLEGRVSPSTQSTR